MKRIYVSFFALVLCALLGLQEASAQQREVYVDLSADTLVIEEGAKNIVPVSITVEDSPLGPVFKVVGADEEVSRKVLALIQSFVSPASKSSGCTFPKPYIKYVGATELSSTSFQVGRTVGNPMLGAGDYPAEAFRYTSATATFKETATVVVFQYDKDLVGTFLFKIANYTDQTTGDSTCRADQTILRVQNTAGGVTNNPPVAASHSVSLSEDTPTSFTLSATDADGDLLTFATVAGPSNGSATISGNTVTYTPSANFFGSDSFTWRANDGTSNSNVATVSITVNPVNDAPVITSTPPSTNLTVGNSFFYTPACSDVDGDTCSFTSSGTPPPGITWSGTSYSGSLTTAGGWSVTSTADDGNGGTATQTLVFVISNAPPVDTDSDGVPDSSDNCPLVANANQADFDGDGIGDVCDSDMDGDGVTNYIDQCANTPLGESVNVNGCSQSQLDDDGDGVMNDTDACPNTPSGEAVNAQGCSLSQLDTDGDGVSDAVDQCPNTPAGSTVNSVGCVVVPPPINLPPTLTCQEWQRVYEYGVVITAPECTATDPEEGSLSGSIVIKVYDVAGNLLSSFFGTAPSPGIYRVSVTVKDSGGLTATPVNFAVTVRAPVAVNPVCSQSGVTTLPRGAEASVTISCDAGSVFDATLPSWLEWSRAGTAMTFTGTTPTVAGTYTVPVTVTNATGGSTDASFTIVVVGGNTIVSGCGDYYQALETLTTRITSGVVSCSGVTIDGVRVSGNPPEILDANTVSGLGQYSFSSSSAKVHVFMIEFLEGSTVRARLNLHVSFASGVDIEEEGVPVEFALHQNYPNPFNPTTTIVFDIPDASSVQIRVVNMLGKEVWNHDDSFTPGTHRIAFDASGLPSGAYLYMVRSESGHYGVGRMTLVK